MGRRTLTTLVVIAMMLWSLPFGATPASAAGTITITSTGTAFAENFDTLANSGTTNTALPTGWALNEVGTSARVNSAYAASTGSDTSGDVYSFGASGSVERAFGTLLSGTLTPTIGAAYTNASGLGLTKLTVSYTGEQWRLGATGRTDRLDFQFSADATSLTTGTWTDIDPLDFTAPNSTGTVGLLDGNSAANRTAISATFAVAVPDGGTFWIRWNDFNATSSDDGLAVDDFSLTAFADDAAPGITTTTPASGATNVTVGSNIGLTFSEPVNVSSAWYAINCTTSGSHAATASGGPVIFTLDPATDFANNEDCTVTVFAALVADQDTNDPPDNMTANYGFSFHTIPLDAAPSVVSRLPANGSSGAPAFANVTVGFSEPVTLTGTWYSISCATSGAHTATVSSGGTNVYVLDPDADFAAGESCTVTVRAANVTDQDTIDPPDNMAADDVFTFTTATSAVTHLVISQVYGGGGNSGATLKNDFIELYNPTATTVDTTGWSVQYASSTGTSWAVTPLGGVISPGRYYLVQEAAGSGGTVNLPAPNAVGTIAMALGSGKVALRSSTTPFSGTCPTGAIDFVGYGAANCSETSPTPLLSNTTSAIRKFGGQQDTDNNLNDFDVATPNPRATADHAPSVVSTSPANNDGGVSPTANIVVNFSEPVALSGDWFSLTCGVTGTHTVTVSGGPTSFTLDPDSDFNTAGETCTARITGANVSDQDSEDPPDTMTADVQWSFAVVLPGVSFRIHDVQGVGHLSPFRGTTVSNVPGIVTQLRPGGFYLQDPSPDADERTSEGISVSTGSTVAIGDSVTVTGIVTEVRTASGNLSTTTVGTATTTVVSHGNPVPGAVRIDIDRIVPKTVIEDDAGGDVDTSGVFDPANDGIDFWESLEGMRVDLGGVVITGPSKFHELSVLANNGVGATGRTARGGIVISATDKNPEKVELKGVGFDLPDANTGDHFAGPVVGVIDYDFGNFMVQLATMPALIRDGVVREVTAPPGVHELAVATFNVENLSPLDPQSKFDTLASLIVGNLLSPDVISLEEVQDNNGSPEVGGLDDGTVDATQTLTKLRDAIVAAGGPSYAWREIDPVNDQDGGAPGGNIRQVFFFRSDRGIAFVDRPGAGSTTANSVVNAGGAPQLQYSPGRIQPADSAFNSSRKPLAAEFTYNGHHLFVIANHWNSKGGDDSLWGHKQPPVLSSETQRRAQATIVRDFSASILAIDPSAEVVVLGDLNDFEFSNPLLILKSAPLNDLIETLDPGERYSYVFDGNSQTLDHIVVSNSLLAQHARTDVVHVNAEFWDQASDHDPQVATLPLLDTTGPTITLTQAPAPNANGWNNTDVSVTFTCEDNVGIASCVGDTVLTAETAGQLVTGTATDLSGNTTSLSTTVMIDKTAPTYAWTGSRTYTVDQTVAITCTIIETLSGVDPALPSHCDSASGPAVTFALGTHTLTAAATDRAGNASSDSSTFTVSVGSTSLCALTRTYIGDPGISNSLCVKLDASAAALERGLQKTHDNQLAAFVNEVNAQRGKAISDTNADTLIALAGTL